jgi:hypothetical protein
LLFLLHYLDIEGLTPRYKNFTVDYSCFMLVMRVGFVERLLVNILRYLHKPTPTDSMSTTYLSIPANSRGRSGRVRLF